MPLACRAAAQLIGIYEVVEHVIINSRNAMKIFRSIEELLGELDEIYWDSAVFIRQDSWGGDPQRAEILVLHGDAELEDVVPGTHLPKLAKSRDMRQLLDMETFRDIVDFERKRNPGASVADIICAIDFYREKDDFYDP
ncbi:hypothetical protein GCM10025794_01460 [Massilia kyonggiensis]